MVVCGGAGGDGGRGGGGAGEGVRGGRSCGCVGCIFSSVVMRVEVGSAGGERDDGVGGCASQGGRMSSKAK